MASSTLALAIAIAAHVAPASVSLQPTHAELKDNLAAGTVVATAAVKNSDGSTAPACNLTSSMSDTYAVAGCNIVTARALTSADDGGYNITISAQPLAQQTSPAGTIVCAPGPAPAKYCSGNTGGSLQWHGHNFAFYQPATPAHEQGNYSLLLDGKPAGCGGTAGEWSGFELAIDVNGELYMQCFNNGSPGWAIYDNSGTDSCFISSAAPTL